MQISKKSSVCVRACMLRRARACTPSSTERACPHLRICKCSQCKSAHPWLCPSSSGRRAKGTVLIQLICVIQLVCVPIARQEHTVSTHLPVQPRLFHQHLLVSSTPACIDCNRGGTAVFFSIGTWGASHGVYHFEIKSKAILIVQPKNHSHGNQYRAAQTAATAGKLQPPVPALRTAARLSRGARRALLP